MPKHYTVSDGELVLFLWPAEEGGYNVTSPLNAGLITQAGTVEEAFAMARDALGLLTESLTSEPASSPKTNAGVRKASKSQKPRRTSV